MSESKQVKDGGPAFPIGSGDMRDPVGVSIRDYFAAKAMQAMVGNLWERVEHPPQHQKASGVITQTTVSFPEENTCTGEQHDDVGVYDEAVAQSAYRIADAMLAERTK